jgi:hypothetical protein
MNLNLYKLLGICRNCIPFICRAKKYDGQNLLLRMEQSNIFRVPWVDERRDSSKQRL